MGEISLDSNRICGRVCAEIRGTLGSPLLAGSGENYWTDADILMAANGNAILAGSSLAGVLREYLQKQLGPKAAEDLFGGMHEAWKIGKSPIESERQSRIFVYDTEFQKQNVIHRDGVRLDEYKAAKDMSKYDMQAVDTGTKYRIRLEILQREQEVKRLGSLENAQNKDRHYLKTLIFGLKEGEVRTGAKSHRGYGKFQVDQASMKSFSMESRETYLDWLDWEWEQPGAFSQEERLNLQQLGVNVCRQEHCLEVPLQVKGTLLVRRYGIESINESGQSIPDYVQLTSGGKAVIPGSSWAGAIRSKIAHIVNILTGLNNWEESQRYLDTFFGSWPSKERQGNMLKVSEISMEESCVHGGHALPLTRNAIDRFTGGTKTRAVYNEVPWAGGETTLSIRWDRKLEQENIDDCGTKSQVLCGLLLWAILDLQQGLLAVGGETGVGRGIFQEAGPILLDGAPITDMKLYLEAAAKWCRHVKGGA